MAACLIPFRTIHRSLFVSLLFTDLLKEKLEDPENYASVVDSTGAAAASGAAGGTGELYQDPVDLARKQHHQEVKK
jgi:hypothetical protein